MDNIKNAKMGVYTKEFIFKDFGLASRYNLLLDKLLQSGDKYYLLVEDSKNDEIIKFEINYKDIGVEK